MQHPGKVRQRGIVASVFAGALAIISATSSAESRSIYYPLSNELKIINDFDSLTYLGDLPVACSDQIVILESNSNVYPWGTDAGDRSGIWSLNDEFGKNGKTIVSAIKNWQKQGKANKSFTLNAKGSSSPAKCLREARQLMIRALKSEEDCKLRNRSLVDTDDGRKCMNSYEYQQYQEYKSERKKQIEADRLKALQAEMQDYEARNNQRIIREKEERRRSVLDAMQKFSDQYQQAVEIEEERRYQLELERARQPVVIVEPSTNGSTGSNGGSDSFPRNSRSTVNCTGGYTNPFGRYISPSCDVRTNNW